MQTPGPWTASETNQINYMGDTLRVEVIYRGDRDGQEPIAFVPSIEDAQLIELAPNLQARVNELEAWRIGAVNRIAELKSQINHLTNDNEALRQALTR